MTDKTKEESLQTELFHHVLSDDDDGDSGISFDCANDPLEADSPFFIVSLSRFIRVFQFSFTAAEGASKRKTMNFEDRCEQSSSLRSLLPDESRK